MPLNFWLTSSQWVHYEWAPLPDDFHLKSCNRPVGTTPERFQEDIDTCGLLVRCLPLKNWFSILDDSVQDDPYQMKKHATAQKIRNPRNPISTWHGLDESWSSQYEQVVETPSPKLKELNSLAHVDVSERTWHYTSIETLMKLSYKPNGEDTNFIQRIPTGEAIFVYVWYFWSGSANIP